MSESHQIGRWQSKKRTLFAVFSISLALAATVSLLRFDRRINDALSGPPRPMEVVARRFAENMAYQTGRELPIIVVNDESADWEKLKDSPIENPNDVYYVLHYSEHAHSICIIAYAPVGDARAVKNVVTLRPGEGRNYGRAFTIPVRVVPTFRYVKIFTATFLALLDWNKEMKLTDGIIAVSTLRSAPASATEMSLDISLNVFDLRSEVGRRHSFINHLLLFGSLTFLALAILSAVLGWTTFKKLRQHCLVYDFDLTPRVFLLQDLRVIEEQAQRKAYIRQQQISQQLRSENVLRRSTAETVRKLRSLLENELDPQRRVRVQECLDRAEPDAMNALWDELHPEAGQRTPEERLTLLLESLKEYCSGVEVEHRRREASVILQTKGFRPARDFVVRMHKEFKTRAKEAEQHKLTLKMEDPS